MSGFLQLYVVDLLERVNALASEALPPLDSDAAIYARISDDAEGQEAGVTRQTEDSHALAERHGDTVPDASVFIDNDVSASTNSRKPRPEFERLLAYIVQGQVRTVYAYSNSRLTRRPMELEILILLAQQYGAEYRTAVSGSDDLSTADGRMVARYKAVADAAEAERTSERVKRQKQGRLASGLPLGSRYRTYGYTRDWQIIEEEAAIVREAFDRIGRGESLNSVHRDLIARGIEPVGDAKRWHYQTTRRMIESRIYCGRLSYKGEDAGPAKVPAIVSEAAWNAAQGRERKAAWNTRSGLLSGIATCSKCHTGMTLMEGAYVCSRIAGGCGSVRIKREWLDNAAEASLWFLMTWRRTQELKGSPNTEDKVAEAEALVVRLDAEIEEVQAAVGASLIDLADALPILKEKRARRSRAAEEAEAAQEAAQGETWRHWEDYVSADLSSKRTMLKRHLTAIMVDPSTKPGRSSYDPDRFNLVTVYRDAHGNVRTLSGHDCDWHRKMRDAALRLDPDAFSRIEIGWGEDDPGAVVKGEGEPWGLPDDDDPTNVVVPL